jgi:hypothetical protein
MSKQESFPKVLPHETTLYLIENKKNNDFCALGLLELRKKDI